VALSGTQRDVKALPAALRAETAGGAAVAVVAVEGEGGRLRAELSAETAPAARERARAQLLAAAYVAAGAPTEFSGDNILVKNRVKYMCNT
jgi:hypothetical protein